MKIINRCLSLVGLQSSLLGFFITKTSFPQLNRNKGTNVVILMGLAHSHRKIIDYQQIKEHFILLLIESMKLVRNICCNFESMYI